jgi:flavin-dependent dehydrogenase
VSGALPGRLDTLVLGAGPAGVAAAVALARLGARVGLVSRARAPAVEGLSARTLARLRAAGLSAAADCAAAPGPRLAVWAAGHGARGSESLVDRAQFDAALRAAAGAAGVRLLDAVVRGVEAGRDGWRVHTSAGPLHGRTLLDARGRRARGADARGPALAAFSELWRIAPPAAARSAVIAVAEGWCWFAQLPDGRVLRQYVGAPRGTDAGRRGRAWIDAARAALPELAAALERGARSGAARTCAATARYALPARGVGHLRIGDAAVAIDPLSGQGVYEALGSAQAAAAAINTYLSGGEWQPAARFVNERAAEVWRRSLATAGSFYRAQALHAGGPFWSAIAAHYEAVARDAGPRDPGPGRFALRPVLNGTRIELRTVWVSPAAPRGIWQIDGRELRGAHAGQGSRARHGIARADSHEVR